MNRPRSAAAALATTIVLSSCAGVVRPASPRDRYADALERAGLGAAALGRDWLRAGTAAIASPVDAALPFRETAYVPPARATAVAYRVTLPRGRRFVAEVTFDSTSEGRLFVDLFRVTSGRGPDRVASLPEGAAALTYDVERDGEYVLLVQPELLRGGRFTIVERTLASLPFPVPSADIRAVQSRFGVARDAGAREHEGIDIFAPRSTPVVAVTNGTARQDTNTLGGNVVWLSDGFAGPRYYYAHLDRWAITGTARVAVGDVLGYVGNTGNARSASPHLHFGIYDNGPLDPLPFVSPDDALPPAPGAPVAWLDTWVRVSSPSAGIRAGPHAGAHVRRALDRGWVARVAAVSDSSFRVVLPDASVGYVTFNQTTPALTGRTTVRLSAGVELLEAPWDSAPVMTRIVETQVAEVLGRFDAFDLVTFDRGEGWVRRRVGTSRLRR